MAKEITTTGSKKLKTLMKEFNDQYPYLRLGIFDFSAKEKVENGEDIFPLDTDKRLFDVRAKQGDGEITITGNKFICNLEKEFEIIFGLYVQVCYTCSDGERHYSTGISTEMQKEFDVKDSVVSDIFRELDDDRKTIYAFNKYGKENGFKKWEWK